MKQLTKELLMALPPEERADALLSLRKQIMQAIKAMPKPKRTEALKNLEALKQKGIKLAAMYRTQQKILSGDYPHKKTKGPKSFDIPVEDIHRHRK